MRNPNYSSDTEHGLSVAVYDDVDDMQLSIVSHKDGYTTLRIDDYTVFTLSSEDRVDLINFLTSLK